MVNLNHVYLIGIYTKKLTFSFLFRILRGDRTETAPCRYDESPGQAHRQDISVNTPNDQMSGNKINIQASLEAVPVGDFTRVAKNLLATLGYRSRRTLHDQTGTAADFIGFPSSRENKTPTKAEQLFLEHVCSVWLLFQITSDEIIAADQPKIEFAAASFEEGRHESFLFFAVELKDATYTRGQYAQFTREINKRLSQPAVVLFRTSDHRLSLSFVRRREHKRNEQRDVLGHVSLIRQITTANPHRAHLDILADLSLDKCLEWIAARNQSRNFDGLLAAWLAKLDTEELNRRFYGELFEWFKKAVDKAKFPRPDRKEQQVIRLITRILFVWFIKEKELVRKEWFISAEIKNMLCNFGGSDYYRAVLQNLFFATLNTEMRTRGFSTRTEPNHRVFSRFRYQSLIRDTKRFEDLMSQTPFINGGLFECLDDEESRSAGGERIDMFSDPDPSDGPEAAKARREAWEQLNVPDSLFFDQSYGLFPLLERYKFTVEENTPIEKEVALDPELLGKVFENLLAAYNPETRDTARRQTGSYYTPRAVVDYMVEEALIAVLTENASPEDDDATYWQERLRYLLDYEDACTDANELFGEVEKESVMRAIAEIKVLDPAVGSGAFPMGILHKLTLALQRLDPKNIRWKELQKERAREQIDQAFETPNKDEREAELLEISENFERYSGNFGRKLYLIQNSIFGVDIQSIACQIAKLRFFISLAIEQTANRNDDNFGIKPLPNLETRFVAADTLLSLDIQVQGDLGQTASVSRLEHELKENRERHFHATTRQQKLTCKDKDKQLREALAIELQNAGFASGIAEKIASWNPYNQNDSANWFDPEYMFGIENGFDIIIGNPPYIQLQKNKGELGEKYQDAGYKTFARRGDIYQLFYERGCQLLKPNRGILVYITSNSWLKAVYGKSLRRYLGDIHSPARLLEMGKDVFENAIVDTNILIMRAGHHNVTGKAIDMDCLSDKSFPPPEHLWGELRLKGEAPWIALSMIEQSIMDKMEDIGTPLKEWDIDINYGIKTGYNDAFIIDNKTKKALVDKDPRSAEILKPVLRGRHIKRYQAEWAGLWLINTHNGYKSFPPIDIDQYPAVKDHLYTFYPRLSKRQDKGQTPYNLRNCAYHAKFNNEKLIWRRVTNRGMFAYQEKEIYCINAGCMITGDSLKYLCAVLNSKISTWYSRHLFPTSGTGTFHWEIIHVEQLLIPQVKKSSQLPIIEFLNNILTSINDLGFAVDIHNLEREIDQLIYDLFGFSEQEIATIDNI